MAQTMLLMASVSTSNVVDLKRDSLLNFQVQKLRPKPFSHLLLPSLPTNTSSSQVFTTFALFKSKTKATPKKVFISFWSPLFDSKKKRVGSINFPYKSCSDFLLLFTRLSQSQSQRLKMVSLAPPEALVLLSRMSSLWVELPWLASLWVHLSLFL